MWRCLVVLVVACGGGGASSDSNGSPDAPKPTTDAAIDAPATALRRIGNISIFEQTIQPIGTLTFESADFVELAATVNERVDGACAIRTGGATGTRASAGTISIRSQQTTELLLTPDAMNKYTGMQQQGARYTSGEPMAVSAGGATVPSWGVAGLTFPTAIALDPPPPFAKSGYALSWSGTTPVRVLITQSGTGVAIVCRYTGVTSASIPASALADLSTGTTNDKQISIIVGAAEVNALAAGAWSLEIIALKASYAVVTFVQ